MMRFRLIDRILDIQPGRHIVAVKTLRADEDYLRDHFPRFPVMPGVLMLEAMFQASMWLVRRTEDFATSVVLLKEARSIKFADFVQPGQSLRITAGIIKHDSHSTTLKAEGFVDSSAAVSGRLVLERHNQRPRNPADASDAYTCLSMRREFERLLAGNT